MIILRGVNVFPTQIEEVLLATDWCGGHFIIELTREGRMDEMTVLAEARPESWDGNGLVEHAERVTTYIKNTIASPRASGPCAPRRWSARSARPSAYSTSGRRINTEPQQMRVRSPDNQSLRAIC